MSTLAPFRLVLALGLLLSGWLPAFAAPRKVVLIAGPITGHPKEAHEYEKSVVLLKQLLESSPSLKGQVRAEVHYDGWPADPTTLDDADTIVLMSDGGDHRETDHPLYVGERFAGLRRQMQRGCGLVFYHWTTFHPVRVDAEITDWVGGYFDYETGPPPQRWRSAIQTWDAAAVPVSGHPVTRGVTAWSAPEEFYYRIRFRDPDPRLKPVLLTRPPRETADQVVAWTVERADGGRGFGTTGGHFYAQWWKPEWRRLMLNAIAWTARLEVPAGGVESEEFGRFKALIVTGANHPAHDWSAVSGALVQVLERDPRMQVHVLTEPDRLGVETAVPGGFTGRLADYDLVVWNYVNWERPGLAAPAREALLGHLRRGGGLALIHFGASAFHPSLPGIQAADVWPEFSEKIARRVWEHRPPLPSGHDPLGKFRVEVSPGTHPVTAGLAPFETEDELYFHQAGREPIEPLVTAWSKVTRTNEPLAWVYSVGSARVFQTLLGHGPVGIHCAGALIRRGAVWAAGREPLAVDPPATKPSNYVWRDGGTWKPVASVAPAPPVGTPSIAGREPSNQGEKDWVDNRWAQTDVGPFLASALPLPGGAMAKGLSIRVGEKAEGTMAFDTSSLTWRAAWLGAFLQFNPGRFGLIEAPKPGGSNLLTLPAGDGWPGQEHRYRGLHRNGRRVVLEYEVGGHRVWESPALEWVGGQAVWVRRLTVAGGEPGLRVRVGGQGISRGSSRTVIRGGPTRVEAELVDDGLAQSVVILGYEVSLVGENDGSLVTTEVKFSRAGGNQRLFREDDGSLVATLPGGRREQHFEIRVWAGPAEGKLGSAALGGGVERADVAAWAKPGPGVFPQELRTVGQVGATTDFLTVDTLTLPYENPWKALLFAAGVDFTPSGEGYVCTIHGDVWRVTGVDATLRDLRWRRFATGLFQPLGLRVRDGEVFVLGRDRITRLKDENGDGEADFHESFYDGIATSTGGHDYVTSLERDEAGNFYYVDPQGVHRVQADGRRAERLASGFRNPNGMGVRPDGKVITVAPQQGSWTPSSQIAEIRVGGYYGFGGPRVTPERPLGYDAPLCWIPHAVDNSSGGQVWIPEGAWGELGGQMLHLLWGRCGLMLALRDETPTGAQGAVVPLPVKFLSGPNRATFRQADQALYVAGSTGWQTSAARDGAVQRVRYTGQAVPVPIGWKARPEGLEVTFGVPLDRATAGDVGSWAVKRWNYRYAGDYGSKDWSVTDPKREGRDEVEVTSATLSGDGRTVVLGLNDPQAVMQMEVKYNVEAAGGGKALRGQFWLTVNPKAPQR